MKNNLPEQCHDAITWGTTNELGVGFSAAQFISTLDKDDEKLLLFYEASKKGIGVEDIQKIINFYKKNDLPLIEVIQKVRSMNSEVPILVRTRNDDQLDALQAAGANEVVPESLEGSLMLVSQVLSLSGVPFSKIMRRVQKERKNHYNHLHGFFQGEQTDMSPNAIDRIEFAHAILINHDSFARGKTLASLALEQRRVHIVALHRDDVETESPQLTTTLQDQDTLVVRGKPRRIERVERYLQEGS